jgi:seryl-tRNA synthetase
MVTLLILKRATKSMKNLTRFGENLLEKAWPSLSYAFCFEKETIVFGAAKCLILKFMLPVRKEMARSQLLRILKTSKHVEQISEQRLNGKNTFLHTLTVLVLPLLEFMVGICDNYQQPDGFLSHPRSPSPLYGWAWKLLNLPSKPIQKNNDEKKNTINAHY